MASSELPRILRHIQPRKEAKELISEFREVKVLDISEDLYTSVLEKKHQKQAVRQLGAYELSETEKFMDVYLYMGEDGSIKFVAHVGIHWTRTRWDSLDSDAVCRAS